jgi:hypothetical protein
MVSNIDLPDQPDTCQQQAPRSFKALKLLALIAAILLSALVAGIGGYWLGIRIGQKSEIISQPAPIATTTPTTTITATPTVSPTIPILPTQMPTLTENWKTYTNARWGLSFKYPETWFPQEVPESSQRGDSIDFYPYGVTPHPGGEGDPSNAVFTVENQEGHSQQTNEQFISEARQTGGKRVLNVAGKPAIRGDGYRGEWYYAIKLSSTRLLILAAINEDGAKRLDTFASTINFTNE